MEEKSGRQSAATYSKNAEEFDICITCMEMYSAVTHVRACAPAGAQNNAYKS